MTKIRKKHYIYISYIKRRILTKRLIYLFVLAMHITDYNEYCIKTYIL